MSKKWTPIVSCTSFSASQCLRHMASLVLSPVLALMFLCRSLSRSLGTTFLSKRHCLSVCEHTQHFIKASYNATINFAFTSSSFAKWPTYMQLLFIYFAFYLSTFLTAKMQTWISASEFLSTRDVSTLLTLRGFLWPSGLHRVVFLDDFSSPE